MRHLEMTCEMQEWFENLEMSDERSCLIALAMTVERNLMYSERMFLLSKLSSTLNLHILSLLNDESAIWKPKITSWTFQKQL